MSNVLVYLLSLLFIVSPSWADEKSNGVNQGKGKIAVFDFEVLGDLDKNISRPISDGVRQEFVKSGQYDIIDRDDMNNRLKEKGLQLENCTKKDCALTAGRSLGVDKLVIGTIGQVGQTYYISQSQVDVNSGKTEKMEDETCKCQIDELISSGKRVAAKLLGLKIAKSVQDTGQVLHSEKQQNAELTGRRDKGFYAGVYYILTKAKLPQDTGTFGKNYPVSVSKGTGIGMKLGYSFNKYLALEGAISSSEFTVNKAYFSYMPSYQQGSLTYSPDNKKMKSTVTAVDVTVSYPIDWFMPYLQVGYGQYRYSADLQSASNALYSKGYGITSNEYRLGAGLCLRIIPSLFVDVRYITSEVADVTDIGLSYQF